MKKLSVLFLAAVLALVTTVAQAATNVTANKILRSGTIPTPTTVTNGLATSVSLTAGEFLVITTTSMYVSATATDQRTSLEGYTTDATCFVPINTTKVMGPFMKNRWADGSGNVQFTWTATGTTTGATFWTLRLPWGEPENQTK